ncbi:MAG: M23 family metallopeptidase [Microcella sp.]|nr:M23 family metallopeptidase [Microcella sp.]
MLHLLHPSISRAAALDPYRLRHRTLVAAAALVAVGALLMNAVPAAIAVASETDEPVPATQLFAAASIEAEPLEPLEYTVDVRPALMYPVGAGAPVGSGYGFRLAACGACSTNHNGIDWNPGRGHPVVAMADGVVSEIGDPRNSLGVHLTIDHVVNGQAVTSVYAHLESGSIPVRVGQEVRGGDLVGTVGTTGVTTGPHLHFEVRIGGQAVNPARWLAANGAQ